MPGVHQDSDGEGGLIALADDPGRDGGMRCVVHAAPSDAAAPVAIETFAAKLETFGAEPETFGVLKVSGASVMRRRPARPRPARYLGERQTRSPCAPSRRRH